MKAGWLSHIDLPPMSILVSLAIILSLFSPAIDTVDIISVKSDALYGIVVGVSDGDTVKVLTPTLPQITIRLYGIDAPEKKQPFGGAAKRYLSDLCYGKFVIVEVRGKDRYGRTIGVLHVSGQNLNEEMVRAGLAWWYRQYARKYAALEALEQRARESGIGLWSDKEPIAPWLWRKRR